MKLQVTTTKLVISVLVVFLVSLFSCTYNLEATMASRGFIPDDVSRLKLVAVENETDALEFQTFYGDQGASSFVFPQTTFKFSPQKELGLAAKDLLIVKCCKGSYLPVFIQDGDIASGEVEAGYDGPFYLSMWMQFPQVSESAKTHIRYAVKRGKSGRIGLKIDIFLTYP